MNKHIIFRTVAVIAVLALALFLVTAREKKLHSPGVTAPVTPP